MSISTDLHRGAAVMAHTVIFEGKSYRLAVARHMHDGSLSVTPFGGEEHTTEFMNGTIIIEKTPGGFTVTPQKPCDREARR